MVTHWSVRRQIIFGFSTVILIMVALCAFGLTHLRTIASRTESLRQDSLPGFKRLEKVRSESQEEYSLLLQRLSASADQKRLLDPEIKVAEAKVDEAFSEYEGTIFLSQERELFNEVKAARASFNAAVTNVQRNGIFIESPLLRDVNAVFLGYSEALDKLTMFNESLGEKAAGEIFTAEESTLTGMLIALVLGLVFSIVSTYVLSQVIDRTIIRVKTSATEIAATSQEQLATANEVAATTAEVGATSKEISATAKELLQTVKDVTAVAEQTAAVAASGQAGLGRMQATMQQIVEASSSINAKLAALSEKAGSIGAVVTTITKVADQTNLLSLNAAIEAEKAGEYGRGFSVVATEIRRLADQTALATTDIEQIIKEIQSAVSAGVMGMDKFSEEVRRGVEVVRHVSDELTQIIQQVQNLSNSFETVTDGMQSQAVGAQQISEALMQLTEASRQTVDSLRQSNIAIEHLNTAARTMQDGVARFAFAS